MKIGTLSFKLIDWEPDLSGKRRRKIIRDVCREFEPDILLCAGFAVENIQDVNWLCRQQLRTYCYVETEGQGKMSKDACYYLIIPGQEKSKKFESQTFATRKECKGGIGALEDCNKRSHTTAGGLSAYLMVCGELNIIKGRDNPQFQSTKIREIIRKSSIVLNPNHDRMGNPGTLDAKRKLLSSQDGGKSKLYINSANWNTDKSNGRIKNQNRCPPTLHTVYLDGKKLKQDRLSIKCEYEYRQVILPPNILSP